jgi:hypothetical protein
MPMVSYDLVDEVPEVPREEREKVAALSDDEIDYSDIPEISDFSGFVRVCPGTGRRACKKTEPGRNRSGQRCNCLDRGRLPIPDQYHFTGSNAVGEIKLLPAPIGGSRTPPEGGP